MDAAAAAQKRKRAEQEEEQAATDGRDVLDLRAAKRLRLGFERRLRDNLEARMKHPDDPARFADSELALHAETYRLRLFATRPRSSPISSCSARIVPLQWRHPAASQQASKR